MNMSGGQSMKLYAAHRSKLCDVRDVAAKQKQMLIIFSSLSRLFMGAETKAQDIF